MPSAPASTVGEPSEAERLDLERRRLECEKLRVDIAQAAAPWWTRPGYVGSLVPIVLALVAFFSALATGFFNTEREQLRTEIEALTARRDTLAAANEEIQRKLDDAYVKLRAASADARYAIGHITGMSQADNELGPVVRSAIEKLPDEEARAVGNMLGQFELFVEIGRITGDELDRLEKSLASIPASAWATELQPVMPGEVASDRTLMRAPDGRYYDPNEGRFYTAEELKRLEEAQP